MIYKVLNQDGGCCHGGSGAWPLPTQREDGSWEPGAWLEVTGELAPCENGLHLCDGEEQLLDWLGPAIFEAEYEGERIDAGNKIVVRMARLVCRIEAWNERGARMFACDCAERVLPLFEAKCPHDNRPRRAIEVARSYAAGTADEQELAAARAAAWDAAWAAVWDAALAAAWAAARASAWDAARDAAWAAARDAARAVAWAAVRDAAWAFEREWQAERLGEVLRG
jgi:hypothetical protein